MGRLNILPGIGAVLQLLRAHWRRFFAIHLVATLISALLLAPLYGLLSGWVILASGDAALTDQDIALFVLSPAGFAVFVVMASLLATFWVFESALLFLAGLAAARGKAMGLGALLAHVLARFGQLFSLAVVMVLKVALMAAPFLAAAAWVVLTRLGEYDINYYLAQRPPVFYQAALLIAAIVLPMVWLLARMLAGWVVALPLLLLEGGRPRAVLRSSRDASRPVRGPLTRLLVIWLLLSAGLFAAAAGLLNLLTGGALALAGSSLQTAAWLMAGLLLLWSLLNFVLSFISGTSLMLGVVLVFDQAFPGRGDGVLQRLSMAGSPAGQARQWWQRPAAPASLALLLVAIGAGAWFTLGRLEQRFSEETEPQIMAHRGASFEAPENTLAAIALAIEQGADWVEIDVQETPSGDIVVIHDSDLMKVAGVPLKVSAASLAELQAVDIGSWKDARFSDQRIPTLQQVLELARGRIGVNIELKYYGHEQALEERVARIVEAAGMQDQVVLMSLHYPGVKTMQALRPDWQVGLLASVSLGDVTRLQADFFAVNAKFANRRFVAAAGKRGKQVYTWTVNEPVMMSLMVSRGVDAIITDRPALAREVFAQRAELEPVEKVLLLLAGQIGTKSSAQ